LLIDFIVALENESNNTADNGCQAGRPGWFIAFANGITGRRAFVASDLVYFVALVNSVGDRLAQAGSWMK
jgi:hypothetical protein